MIERPRGEDAKRHSLYKAAGQLRRGAAKRNLIRKFVKLFSLFKRNFLFSRPKGERLEFVSELERTYKFKRGVQRPKNTDRATECAMTNVVKNLLKIACHSEDNNFLSPKNLLKALQKNLSLNAQNDERDCLQKSLAVCTAAVSVGRHCHADTKLILYQRAVVHPLPNS